MPNTPGRRVAATKIQAAFRGWRTRHGSGFGNLPVLNPWNARHFEVSQPNGIDPVSLNNSRAGNVYFSIPTNNPRVRTPLTRTTFVNYIRHRHPGLQVDPFRLVTNLNPQFVLFSSPVTRANVKVGNVRVHVKPRYKIKTPMPLRSAMATTKRKGGPNNNNNRPTQGPAKRRRVR